MKDCKKIHPLLSLDLEGGLSQKEKALVEKHLQVCITARREREQFERMRRTLLAQPAPEPPSDLHGRIMEKLGMASQAPVGWRPWGRGPLLLAAAMLTVFLFVNRYPEWRQGLTAPPKDQETRANDNLNEGYSPEPPKDKEAQPMAGKGLAGPGDAKKDQAEKPMARTKARNQPVRSKAAGSDLHLSVADEASPSADGSGLSSEESQAQGTMANALPPAGPEALKKSEAKSAAAPAPASAPAEAERDMNTFKLSKEVSGLIWRGDNGISKEAHEELVTDPTVFQALWTKLRPGQKTPELDLEKDAVLYLTPGQEPSEGYSVLITGLEERPGDLAVHYKVQAPTGAAASVLTFPWVLQVIPKPTKPVLFIKD